MLSNDLLSHASSLPFILQLCQSTSLQLKSPCKIVFIFDDHSLHTVYCVVLYLNGFLFTPSSHFIGDISHCNITFLPRSIKILHIYQLSHVFTRFCFFFHHFIFHFHHYSTFKLLSSVSSLTQYFQFLHPKVLYLFLSFVSTKHNISASFSFR